MGKPSRYAARKARFQAWKERKRKASSKRFHAVSGLPSYEQVLQAAVDHVKKLNPEECTPAVVSDAILAVVFGVKCPGFAVKSAQVVPRVDVPAHTVDIPGR